MRRGWEVELEDGTIIQEINTNWKKVPKNNIIRLSLLWEGRRWDIHNKEAYFVKNRASIVPGVSKSFQIEKRIVGWYEGAKKICYTVDEFTGRFSINIEE